MDNIDSLAKMDKFETFGSVNTNSAGEVSPDRIPPHSAVLLP